MKQFHAYADHKTVKELSWDEYLRLLGRRGCMIGWIDDRDILFSKDGNVISLSLRQLQQILNLQQEEKPGRDE